MCNLTYVITKGFCQYARKKSETMAPLEQSPIVLQVMLLAQWLPGSIITFITTDITESSLTLAHHAKSSDLL